MQLAPLARNRNRINSTSAGAAAIGIPVVPSELRHAGAGTTAFYQVAVVDPQGRRVRVIDRVPNLWTFRELLRHVSQNNPALGTFNESTHATVTKISRVCPPNCPDVKDCGMPTELKVENGQEIADAFCVLDKQLEATPGSSKMIVGAPTVEFRVRRRAMDIVGGTDRNLEESDGVWDPHELNEVFAAASWKMLFPGKIQMQRGLLQKFWPERFRHHLHWLVTKDVLPRTAEKDLPVKWEALFAFVIVAQCVYLWIETDRHRIKDGFKIGWYLMQNFFLLLFLFEIAIRSKFLGRPYLLSMSGWFDFFLFLIVATDVWIVTPIGSSKSGGLRALAAFRSLRLLRILRMIRLVTVFRELRVILTGLVSAFRVLFWTALFLLVICYFFAIFMTELLGYGEIDTTSVTPVEAQAWESHREEYWATMPKTLFTLFQMITLEDWGELCRTASVHHPFVWAFFIAFFCLTAFSVLNLVIGVICEHTLKILKNEECESERRYEVERKTVHSSLQHIFALCDDDCDNYLDQSELEQALLREKVLAEFHKHDIYISDPAHFYELIANMVGDETMEGISSEHFVSACERLMHPVRSVDILTLKHDLSRTESQVGVLEKKLATLSSVVRAVCSTNDVVVQSRVDSYGSTAVVPHDADAADRRSPGQHVELAGEALPSGLGAGGGIAAVAPTTTTLPRDPSIKTNSVEVPKLNLAANK